MLSQALAKDWDSGTVLWLIAERRRVLFLSKNGLVDREREFWSCFSVPWHRSVKLLPVLSIPVLAPVINCVRNERPHHLTLLTATLEHKE